MSDIKGKGGDLEPGPWVARMQMLMDATGWTRDRLRLELDIDKNTLNKIMTHGKRPYGGGGVEMLLRLGKLEKLYEREIAAVRDGRIVIINGGTRKKQRYDFTVPVGRPGRPADLAAVGVVGSEITGGVDKGRDRAREDTTPKIVYWTPKKRRKRAQNLAFRD